MDPDAVQWFTSLGVGGVLAAGMFWVYRKDALASQNRIEGIARDVGATSIKLFEMIAGLQTTLAAQSAMLEHLHHRIDIRLGKEQEEDEEAEAET